MTLFMRDSVTPLEAMPKVRISTTGSWLETEDGSEDE